MQENQERRIAHAVGESQDSLADLIHHAAIGFRKPGNNSRNIAPQSIVRIGGDGNVVAWARYGRGH